ncbi:MAG: N-acetylmuramoyl-L-alanine amidase [Bacteroidota bacterium]
MLTIAYYFLQVVLCSGMMIGYYWLVLRNKRFHQYNRFYLLALVLLSWVVPLIKISWSKPVTISEVPQVMQFLSVVADNNTQIEQTISKQGFVWSWDILASGIYFAVAAILLFGMFRAFARLYRLLQEHSCKSVGDVYLILTQAKGTPFSFFRYIFWNEEIDIRSEAGKQILQHELTHVQQKHSFDKLFIQVTLIAGWFNPFFWLVRKEMDMIHEFIADKKAVNNGDTASLAQMLLTAAYPQQQFDLTHPFFFSPIKRRLQMLTNNKNPRFSYIRRLIVLPLLAIVVVLFSFRNKEENGTLSVASVMEDVVDVISSKLAKTERADVPLISSVTLGRTYTVVIDAGHGGNDKGAIGTDGTAESGITLPLAKAIRDLNTNDNIRIILTREDDIYQHPTQKAVIANEYHPDLFVSLHCNETSNTKNRTGYPTTGIEIFIPAKEGSADYNGSVAFANALANSLNNLHQKMLGIKTRNKLIYVLKEVQSPAVLIQTGFMSNQDDLKKLKDASYQKQMAASILQGINNYLRSTMLTPVGKEASLADPGTGVFDALAGDLKTGAGYGRASLAADKYFVAGNLIRSTLQGVQITDTIPSTMSPLNNNKRYDELGTDEAISRLKMGNSLFIVDGVKSDASALSSLDPNQIESVEVLKYPSSVSLYGEAGRQGVVRITSKAYANAQRAAFGNSSNGSLPGIPTTSTALDPLGNPAKNRKIYIKDAIYQGNAVNGTKVWEEMHETTSNNDGIFTINVGQGKKSASIALDDIGKIDWSKGPFFINYKVAVAPSIVATWWVPADNLIDVGTSQLMSVPYALYKGNAQITDITTSIQPGPPNSFLSTDSLGNVKWQTPTNVGPGVTKNNLNLSVAAGKDITIEANTTATVSVTVPGVKKGNPLLVTPQVENPSWSIYSAWVADDNIVNVRFANYTDKAVKVSGSQYRITVIDAIDEPKINAQSVPRFTTNIPLERPLNEVVVTGYGTRTSGTLASRHVFSKKGYPGPITPAEFPGGNAAWDNYVSRNFRIKSGAPRGRYTVNISFTVDESGGVTDIRAENDPGYGAKEEAIRVISNSPKWKPGFDKEGTLVATALKKQVTFAVDVIGANMKPVSSGTAGNLTVTGTIKGGTYSGTLPATGQVLKWNGSQWEPGTISGGTFSGTLVEGREIRNITTPAATKGGIFSEAVASIIHVPRVDIPAEFPGGLPAWTKYLERNLDKDVPLKRGAPPGRYTVIVLFDVAEDGIVSNVRAENDPGYGTKDEATRLFTKGPKWKPATAGGKAIRYTHRQVISFFVSAPTTYNNLSEKKEYYVFCWSRPHPADTSGKKQLIFTVVKKFLWNDNEIRQKADEWGNLVDGICASSSGCTSDLNTYASYDAAQKVMDQIKSRYRDYSIKTVSFN